MRQGTRRDAVLFSVGVNAAHGQRRTNDDKRRAVMTLLNDSEWSGWSDREIARRCNVDHKTVTALRPVTGEIPSEKTYTTKHGTTATMDTSRIGRPKPIQLTADDAHAFQEAIDNPKPNTRLREFMNKQPEPVVVVAYGLISTRTVPH